MTFPEHFLPQQTERLTLRRFTEADLDRFLAYRHDPVVARFQGWSMISEDEAIAFIHEMITAPIDTNYFTNPADRGLLSS